MKSFVIFCFAVCFIAVSSANFQGGIFVPEPCGPYEKFYDDCAMESLCESQPVPLRFIHIPKCGCRCIEDYHRDKYTGLCRPVNSLNQC